MSARTRQFACLTAIVILLLLGLWLVESSEDPGPDSNQFCLVNGTIFGQTSLAAAWCALGPFSLARRLSLSAAWLAAIILCFGWNKGIASEYEPDVLLTFAVVVPCQWALAAVPIAMVAGWFGLRLDTSHATSAVPRHQIGIREAWFLTAVTAVMLGAARYRSGDLSETKIHWGVVALFACLVSANALIAILLISVILFRGGWFRTLVGMLVCLVGATALELGLLVLATGPIRINERLCWAVALINLTQAGWFLAVGGSLTLGGFVWASSRSQTPQARDDVLRRA